MTSLARRLQRRFAELETSRGGDRQRRRVRWLTERLVLVRSTEGTVAVAVAPVWQMAVFVLCGVGLTALVAGLVVAGVFQEAARQQAQQIAVLQDEVSASAERARRDGRQLDRLSQDLSISTGERDHAASAAEIAGRALEERTRLVAERDATLERTTALLEQAAADRQRLERERDVAQARHDDLMNAFGSALRELDGETRRTLADVEKIIAATGIDPWSARQTPRLQQAGARGGPYIPWPGPGMATDHGTMGPFDRAVEHVERLKTLRDTLQQLPLVMPVTRAVITGGFGFRFDPFNGGNALHEGIDLQATHDPSIYAPGAGTVISAGWNGQFGNMVELDHGFGVVTRYGHLSRIAVRRGDVVSAGQQLGVIGATGRATGVHLHYEVRLSGRARDPLKFIRAVDARGPVREAPFAGFELD